MNDGDWASDVHSKDMLESDEVYLCLVLKILENNYKVICIFYCAGQYTHCKKAFVQR